MAAEEEKDISSKMGELIRHKRKEKQLTQKELADRLGVTDKAVSKWERGLSCPDIALLGPLSQALGVSLEELLTGSKETNESCRTEQAVGRAFQYSAREREQKIKRLRWQARAVLSAAFLTAGMVCLLCDFCLNGCFGWSLIVLLSLGGAWLLLLPILMGGEKLAKKTLALLSLEILPYLGGLSLLLKQPMVLRLGAWVSLFAVAALWCVWGISRRMGRNIWRAAGFSLLVLIPMVWGIEGAVASCLGEPNDWRAWVLDTAGTLAFALFCFWADRFWQRPPREEDEL